MRESARATRSSGCSRGPTRSRAARGTGRKRSGGTEGEAQNALAVRSAGVCPTPVLPSAVAVRKKRSISMPPDVDARIEAAAQADGMTYSAWLAAMARKEFLLQEGLKGVAEYERSHGPFTDAEIADADAWAVDAVARSRKSGTRPRRSA